MFKALDYNIHICRIYLILIESNAFRHYERKGREDSSSLFFFFFFFVKITFIKSLVVLIFLTLNEIVNLYK